MKIAEMEYWHAIFSEQNTALRAMVSQRDYFGALSSCEKGFEAIIPALQYRKKKQLDPLTPHVMAFHVIWRFAPVLFAHDAIASLQSFIKANRFLSKHEDDFTGKTEAAYEEMMFAHGMLQSLVRTGVEPISRKELKSPECDAEQARKILDSWSEMGVVQLTQTTAALTTNLDEKTLGVCPSCGVKAEAKRSLLFGRVVCKKCKNTVCCHVVPGRRNSQEV
jgi:hypothetical protein